LDEELIGVHSKNEKQALLRKINPHYIILKPSLIGGFRGSDEWIELAESLNIDWWITSALESNIGLNAIAQYTFIKNNPLPQGLGTGQLYTNNIPSGLTISEGKLFLVRKIT
jgi:O-succinylbenzoate synthase